MAIGRFISTSSRQQGQTKSSSKKRTSSTKRNNKSKSKLSGKKYL